MRKQILLSLGILLFLALGTVGVILYGEGYRFGFDKSGSLVVGTGLLVATSSPDGAQVFINTHLTTATDNTINLAPGVYNVVIQKNGYFPWKKQITVKEQVVAKADATLFPIAPKLESITDSGINNPVIDPSNTKIVYDVASQSASTQNGIYIMNVSNNSLLTLQSGSTQIAADSPLGIAFSTAMLTWSPDGQEILASVPSVTSANSPTLYLLHTNGLNNAPQDVTETFTTTIKPQWDTELIAKEKAQLDTLQPKLVNYVKTDWNNLIWSPDETRILYQASSSATIPQIIPPVIGSDSTPEQRILQPNAFYVYDTKEDKNFLVAPAPVAGDDEKTTWLPDSKHLIYVHNKRISIMDYDGLNPITVYAGPFIDSSVFPWSDASRIIILTNLGNPSIVPNLYTVEL